MNEPKFKIGDKVRVLDSSKIEDYAGGWASEGMDKYVGKICTIKGVGKDFQDEVQYTLNCEGIIEHSDYGFDERGLELAEPENAPKFKAGDKVKVIDASGISGLDYYECDRKFIGNTYTISGYAKYSGDPHTFYTIEENLITTFYEEELVPASQKIVITTDGKTTLARLYDGKKVIKTAEAHCSPDDTFDFSVGANWAMERLNKETPTVIPKDNKIPEILDGYMVEFSKYGAYWSAIVYHNDRGDLCFSSEDWAPVDEFGKNGINTLNRKIKITKIYGRTNNRCASHNTPEDRTLLWERK